MDIIPQCLYNDQRLTGLLINIDTSLMLMMNVKKNKM